MTNRNEALLSLIAGLASTFRVEITESLLFGYRMGLEDLPLEAVESAVRKAMLSCKFMPSCVEMRELAGMLAPGQRAAIAWDAFYDARNQYESVCFDDPLIHAAARHLGGWVQIWQTTGTGDGLVPLQFVRRDFLAAYERFYASGISRERGAYLPGACELANDSNGRRSQPPRQIATGLPPLPERAVYRLGEGAPVRAMLEGGR